MGESQFALSSYLFFVVVSILIIYIIYNFIKRFVEKSEEDLIRGEERSRGSMFRKYIFTFLDSLLAACFMYFINNNDITDALIFFVIIFFLSLLKSDRTRKPKSNTSKTGKIFKYIAYFALLCLFVFITIISTTNIINRVGALVALFMIYVIEKIEKESRGRFL